MTRQLWQSTGGQNQPLSEDQARGCSRMDSPTNRKDTAMELRIDLQDVESDQIHSIGHDAASNTLAICFISRKGGQVGPGSLYHYQNFTADDFAAFQASESKGKHFGAHIKAHPEKYPYTKIEEPAKAA